ncbi:MAG: metallophosphoesterase [Woeseiaceae bacterium]
MKLLITNLKHFLITLTILVAIAVGVAVQFGADIFYGDNDLAYKVGDEGPHIFYDGDQYVVNYIRGDSENGFHVEKARYQVTERTTARVFFPLEDNFFEFEVDNIFRTPDLAYQDNEPIVAISDLESGFSAFRDFLIANKVIDSDLNWIFGKGHLALVGDFVDRGFSTTQLLWFIFKLEQDAADHGGHVHFILGNHEIKNLQGNFQKAAFKYFYVAAILEKQQFDLFGPDALLGRWLASKNAIEKINGHLFAHGGLHPDIADTDLSLSAANEIVRRNYRQAYFRKASGGVEDLLTSTRTGLAWYRGFFETGASEEQVQRVLNHFDASAIVVGHQPQSKVRSLYSRKIWAINVKHPRDYRGSFPERRSEGLLISNDEYFRLLDDGTQVPL